MDELKGITPIILHAVNDLDTGISLLSDVLKGLKSKDVMSRSLYKSRSYGALYWITKDAIKDAISLLVQQNFIESYNWGAQNDMPYYIPKLRLTESGKVALEQKKDVLLIIDPNKREIKQTPTILITTNLFREHRSVEKIANLRQLALSTIWGHLKDAIVLGLISKEEILSKEFMERILAVRKLNPDKRLSELKELLPDVGWGELHCALAMPGNHRSH